MLGLHRCCSHGEKRYGFVGDGKFARVGVHITQITHPQEAKGLVKISALQSEVQDVLRSLGHPSELEVLIPQCTWCSVATIIMNTHSPHKPPSPTTVGVVLDVHIPSLNVYLEFDGPSHFFRNEPFNTEYNAGTRRKTEWLKSEGIKVARVGFLEWEGVCVWCGCVQTCRPRH